jgi:hypothetical protein
MSRELECDESEDQFERVFAKVVKPAQPANPGDGHNEEPAVSRGRPKARKR